jgi:hypothetical protein
MAKRRNQGAAARKESAHSLDYASEIRLREAALYEQRGSDRATDPAPPPLSDPADSEWGDVDRELTMSMMRLEDALRGCTSPVNAAHVRLVLEDTDALTDSLLVLWRQARGKRPSWPGAIARVYRWARDVVEQLADALVVGPDDDREIRASFRLLASYSSLFVRGLIEPALRSAIAHAEETEEDAGRLQVVRERVGLLDWTISCAASELG